MAVGQQQRVQEPGVAGVPRDAVLAALREPGLLRMHFQPIADLARGVVAGYEALARFGPPGQPSPDRWFEAARGLGLGSRLEARALQLALESRAALPPDTFLSVNVSPGALQAAAVAEVLGAAPDLRGVVLELTEQEAVGDYEALGVALAPWRRGGVRVAIDDAGAGFSSLQHVTALRPDLVKIDRELVRGIDTDPARAAVVEALGIFASRLDGWIVAEGVETPGELERLLALGVPLAQGYLLGRPGDGMRELEPRAAAQCRIRARRAGAGELMALAQAARVLPDTATDADVAAARLGAPGHDWLVLVDEYARPTALAGGNAGPGSRTPALCATSADGLTDTARRMAARPSAERLSPAVVCDDQGRFGGLVIVERVMERLADVVDRRAQ